MFGEEFLVAPIVNKGGTRDVYFPTGTSYLEYFNKTKVYHGGATESLSLELEYVPVYVREGAIIPTGDIYEGNHKWSKWEPYLEIQIFPSYNAPVSQFEYYNAAKKAPVKITAVADAKEQSISITYGDLGIPATFVVYGKTGEVKAKATAGGGSVRLKGFESLFG
jgi:alpha-glucosidase (family GH31 glycosyl hydrolase)